MLPAPFKDTRELQEQKREMAKSLVELGYSYRQVMKFLDYKSTRSISNAIKFKN